MEKTSLSLHDQIVLNYVFNPNLPFCDFLEEELELTDEVDIPDVEEVKQKEMEAVVAAEKKQYDLALQLLETAIAIAPKKASLFNNRAQVYQFMGKFDEAFADLTTAIDLAEGNQKRTLCQALCQRGLLHRKNKKDDEARRDFQKAADLGSKFAKTQLVELNPYAALCNQMLRQVMQELK